MAVLLDLAPGGGAQHDRPRHPDPQDALPRQLVPLSSVATQLVTFGVMLAVLVVLNMALIPEVRGTGVARRAARRPVRRARRPGSRSRSARPTSCSGTSSTCSAAPAAVVLPDADPLQLRPDRRLRRAQRSSPARLGQPDHAPDRGHPCAAVGREAARGRDVVYLVVRPPLRPRRGRVGLPPRRRPDRRRDLTRRQATLFDAASKTRQGSPSDGRARGRRRPAQTHSPLAVPDDGGAEEGGRELSGTPGRRPAPRPRARRAAAAEGRRVDRPADDPVADLVRVEHRRDQSGSGAAFGGEVGHRRRLLLRHERLLLRGERRRVAAAAPADARSGARRRRRARAARFRPRRTRTALVDEVEREEVPPGRDRPDPAWSERRAPPGSIGAGRSVRRPSQTIALLRGSSQWYDSLNARRRASARPRSAFSSSTMANGAPARTRLVGKLVRRAARRGTGGHGWG